MTDTAMLLHWELPAVQEANGRRSVDEVARFCQNHGITVTFSKNAPAGDCIDASTKRIRHGQAGIPLGDEMKSLVAAYRDAQGQKKVVALHCRADRRIDFGLAAQAVPGAGGAHLYLVSRDHLRSAFGLDHGTINPISLAIASHGALWQVFDTGLFTDDSGTMMTNAGEHTWGMEFDPAALVSALPQWVARPIALDAQRKVLA